MDNLDRSKALTQRQSAENPSATNTAQVTSTVAVATSDSSDGQVSVDFGGDTVSYSGDQSVLVQTTVNVKSGDSVRVSLVGADGTAKSPCVTGVVGGGDRVASIATVATYKIIASAATVECDPSGAYTPSSISGKAWHIVYADGKRTMAAWDGKVSCEASADGASWFDVESGTTTVTVDMSEVDTAAPGAKYVRFVLKSGDDGITWETANKRSWSDARAYTWAQGCGCLALTDVRIVDATGNYLVKDSSGMYLCSNPGDYTTGRNLKLYTEGMDVRDGTTSLALFSDETRVGKLRGGHTIVKDDGLYLYLSDNLLISLTNPAEDKGLPWDAAYLKISAPGSEAAYPVQIDRSTQIDEDLNVKGHIYANGTLLK